MVSVRKTKQTLAAIVGALFAVSIAFKVYSGLGIVPAILDTVLSSLQMVYNGIPMSYGGYPIIIVAKVIDALILPLLAVLLATVFVDAIGSFSIRERVAIAQIKALKNHMIIVPGNSLAIELAMDMKAEGIKAVLVVKTKKELISLLEKGILAVIGEMDSTDTLVEAGIRKASCLIACDWDDMKNAVIAITAKGQNPLLKVIAVVNDGENIDKMTSIKVDSTVAPEVAAGKEIADGIFRNVYMRPRMKE